MPSLSNLWDLLGVPALVDAGVNTGTCSDAVEALKDRLRGAELSEYHSFVNAMKRVGDRSRGDDVLLSELSDNAFVVEILGQDQSVRAEMDLYRNHIEDTNPPTYDWYAM